MATAAATSRDDAPPRSIGRPPSAVGSAWPVPVIIGVLSAVALWLRVPASARGVLWAEDATEFIGKALSLGAGHSLFLPYAGYLQFVPRVAVGLVTWLLPASAWAYGVTAAAALATGGVCAVIYLASTDIVTWWPARVVLALTPALIGMGAWEVAGTLNNLHSVLLCAVPWLLLARPRSRAGAIVLAVIVCAIVLSEPQAGYFLPLLLWKLRDRGRWLIRGAYLLALVAQAVAFAVSPRAIPAHTALSLKSTAVGFFANAVLGTVISSPDRIGAAMAHHAPFVFALALPIVAAAVICLVLGRWRERLATIAVASAAVVLWAVGYTWNLAVSVYPYSTYSPSQWAHDDTILRYAFAPAVFLMALVCLTASVLARRGRLRSVSWALAVAALAGLIAGSAVTPHSQRAAGPDWRSEVAAARATCASEPGSATVILDAAPPTWNATVPCARLP